jgi:lipopolysaccharide transport system ATP-binding protein
LQIGFKKPMSTVIEVENLGKKYIISHQGEQRYTALRDVITDGAKKLVTRKRKPVPKYEEFWALRNVSFKVEREERIGIIGKNGAGKTTILKIISRVTTPSEGIVKIKGKVSSLLEVGTGFHPELTGRENIFLNGAILGMTRSEIKRRFDEIVQFAEVEQFLDTPVKRYSSGMYVRLAFAVAAHLETEILLVDEVLAVGDAQFQKKCLGKMQDLSKFGKTVLFVSHNLAAISSLCSRCLRIDSGRICEDDKPDIVISNYLNINQISSGGISWDKDKSLFGDREYIIFTSLKIINSEGFIANTIFAEEPFSVELEYVVLKTLTISQLGIKLSNPTGEVIFYSGDVNLASKEIYSRKPGRYKSTCNIPGYLLNQGNYSISLFGHIPGIKMLVNEEPVTNFEVAQSENIGGYGKQPGIIRPLFKWNIEYLGP